MGTVILTRQPNSCDPFIDQAGVLACAYVGRMVGAARKGIVLKGATSQFEPFEEAGPSIIHELKLNRPTGLLLDDSGPRPDFSIANNVADPNFHQVATTQFTVDSQIEKRSISNPPVLIKKEAHCPNLTRFERSLCANLASSIVDRR